MGCWLHLDLYTNQQEAEVERLIGLGAIRYPWRYSHGADFVVLQDPDGNLLALFRKPMLFECQRTRRGGIGWRR